jgi:inner membrane protein
LDPFSHALTSFAVARSGQKVLPRFGTAMLVVAGIAPDLDYASYFGGPESFLRWHRTVFHSLFGAPALACLIAGTFYAAASIWPQPAAPKTHSAEAHSPLRFTPALAVCAIGVACHTLLDIFSGTGLQLLWPFRIHWFRWPLLTEFDPWIVLLLIAGILLPQLFRLIREEVSSRRKTTHGNAGAVVTLLLLAFYLGGRAYLHGRAVELLLSSEYHGREPLAAAAFPSSVNPFEWRGVVATDATIEEIDVPVIRAAAFNSDRSVTHYKPADSAALARAKKTASVQRFLQYAAFPFATLSRREDGYRFELRDFRFPSGDSSAENIIVRVDLNSGLQILNNEFRYESSAQP